MQTIKTPLGNNSTKNPMTGMTWKRSMKLERIARLVADPKGYTNEQIGNMLHCTAQTIVLIKQTPQFHAKMLEVVSGVTSDWDLDLRMDQENSRQELKSMVPSALMEIRNALLSNNPNTRLKAATEIMDREGTHAKVSKTSVSVTQAPNMESDPHVVSNLMQLLASAPANSAGSETIAATGGFTSTASAAAAQQVQMGLDNTLDSLETLEELDVKGKPN